MTDHPTVDHNGAAPDDSIFSRDEKNSDIDVPKKLGPYALSVLLGRGGMGEVWKALDGNLERDVAIKLMRKELLANEEAVRRFSREARAVARLNHPNIVQVYTFGDDQGVLYMVMEMVEGETVSDRLKELGTVPLDICVGLMLQTIEGLSYANARGIIHRDIKPSNLMLTPDFRVKIADFGLAKMIEQDTQMTAAGTTMGSPNYMSPEQARGEEADHRSDIYALGISLFQMLTGKLPFTAQTALAVLLKHIQEPLPANELICAMCDGKVQAVITKMTEKNPDDRYQTYGGLAAAMAALAPQVQHRGGHAVTTSIASTPHRDSEPSTRIEQSADSGLPNPPNHTVTQTPVAVPVQEKSLNPYGVETRANSVVTGKPSKALWWVAGLVVSAVLGAIGAYVIFVDDSPNVIIAENQPIQSTPAIAPLAATATPAPTPVSTPTPAAATPTPTPIATPIITPVPTPFVTAGPSTLVLGAPAAIPGSAVAVVNQAGVTTPLTVGTTMEFTRTATVNGTSYYVGKLNGQEYLVPIEQSSVRTGRFVAPTSTPAVTILRLGTAGSGPDEMVAVFRDDKAVVELQKLPAGTTVTLIQERDPISKIALPNGQQVFVYRGMTQKVPSK